LEVGVGVCKCYCSASGQNLLLYWVLITGSYYLLVDLCTACSLLKHGSESVEDIAGYLCLREI
jgi:hypothetical protein